MSWLRRWLIGVDAYRLGTRVSNLEEQVSKLRVAELEREQVTAEQVEKLTKLFRRIQQAKRDHQDFPDGGSLAADPITARIQARRAARLHPEE